MNDNEKFQYNDIINLPHHISATRPQMSRINRAAQFSPFAALTGYEDSVNEASRLTDKKIYLSDDKKALLDERLRILTEYIDEKFTVSITYFIPDQRKEGGSYETVSGLVRRIDEYERTLIFIDGKKIPLDDICAIEGEKIRLYTAAE